MTTQETEQVCSSLPRAEESKKKLLQLGNSTVDLSNISRWHPPTWDTRHRHRNVLLSKIANLLVPGQDSKTIENLNQFVKDTKFLADIPSVRVASVALDNVVKNHSVRYEMFHETYELCCRLVFFAYFYDDATATLFYGGTIYKCVLPQSANGADGYTELMRLLFHGGLICKSNQCPVTTDENTTRL